MLLALFEGDRLDDERRYDLHTYMNRLLSAHPAAIEFGLQRDPTRWGAPYSPPIAPSADAAAAAAAAAHADEACAPAPADADADAVDPHSSASASLLVYAGARLERERAPQAGPHPDPATDARAPCVTSRRRPAPSVAPSVAPGCHQPRYAIRPPWVRNDLLLAHRLIAQRPSSLAGGA